MHYFLLGFDTSLKDAHLKKIKDEVFSDANALSLDFETLDAHNLSAERLKIALVSLPAIAPQRLVHVYRAERLSKENLALVDTFLTEGHANAVLVLEAETWAARSSVQKNILARMKVLGRDAGAGVNVFDMMSQVARGHAAPALRMFRKLMDNAEAPEKLLGGIVWAWSNKVKPRVSREQYKKGLLVLQEADFQLKRSRFPERGYALEVALVKLSSLVAS